ncbi:nucleotidyltransferase domain-containing protein [Candidatus Halobeggiatoa sp. HSG11]|nr:nucleotidyltransferase domain-containing protein [Candidatus Halobeggiatoa sp. HSG11]
MDNHLNLRPQHRQKIEALIQQYLPNIEVWVYGSRINGRSHDGSDLDLVLRSPDLTIIDKKKLNTFNENLQESTIPFLVEARDWAILPKSFHREIERDYIVLIAR